ncbi:uncharacterized protein Z518_11131 [Rhinocladiella mackenziei CBS 650.93]|uniref:ATP-dependent DNA helicase II subunit 2 n=1 Tax=Rhinocladiella mackenziei CBS 650.93 TaxID=1442369 RepID=A0A0D2I1V0_9EURO|nr:uncharacterized protein Z518_11131 [Rhinocladiella mackenziei CBS 650.93]KIW99718.1 hypothetical protein Z518_11131 [Rhinocladiella mackenziei CBS 650.93]
MEKEATIYVIDLARSMGQTRSGRDLSDLDWALQYVWDKITNIVFTGRKTLQIGIVGLGTDETSNDMQGDESYKNISILQPIAQILMPELQALPSMLKPSKTDDRDVLSGIIIAVDMMMKHCKKLKYKKKIVVITSATGHIDDDDIESTAYQFKNNDIELVVLGIDFDDPDYGFKEKDKPVQKTKNEQILKHLVELGGGILGTMQEAIDELSRPQIIPVRPTPTFKGQLRLGDPQNYDTALCIDVERYFKVSVKRAPTASSYVVRDTASSATDENLATIYNMQKYKVKDESYEGGIRLLERDELAKGYEYGRTAVAISETEQNITKLETEMAYDIIGFIPVEKVERYMLLDNTNMIVSQKGNDKAAFALSSVIHALFELGSAAVGRLVKKDMSEPILTLLSPLAESDFECLVENILPFAEDVRTYRFPPLDKVITVSGKELTEHRNLPNEKLLQSMSDFVDSASLVHDDEEEMAMEDTFSPVLHTIEGAIKYRAVHPNDDIPEKSEVFLACSKQPGEVQERSKAALSRLMAAADVKKVPPKAKGRKRPREVEKPLSGLNVEDLFRREKRTRISPDNAIPEYKRMLGTSDDIDTLKEANSQMTKIVEDLIQNSFGEANDDRVLEMLNVIRQEMLAYEEPRAYNDILRQIKEKLMAGELGGNRGELWWKIRVSKLGLISNEASHVSDVSRTDADAFMTMRMDVSVNHD